VVEDPAPIKQSILVGFRDAQMIKSMIFNKELQ
jgi:hypothetical protein